MRVCVSGSAHANAGVSTLTLAPASRDKYPERGTLGMAGIPGASGISGGPGSGWGIMGLWQEEEGKEWRPRMERTLCNLVALDTSLKADRPA